MPSCERCGEWFPPSRGLLECPACGGTLRSGEVEPAVRAHASEERHRDDTRIRELRSRELTPGEQAELDSLLDRDAVRRGMSRTERDDLLRRERASEKGNWGCRAQAGYILNFLVLGAVLLSIPVFIIEIGPLVALAVLRPRDGAQDWNLIVAATLISTPLVWAGAAWVLDAVAHRPHSWLVGLVIAWGWALAFVFVASRLAA